MTARVISMTATNLWAKAGVMIRESVDTGARNTFMALAVSNNLFFQNRAVPLGATALQTAGSGIVPPYWVEVLGGEILLPAMLLPTAQTGCKSVTPTSAGSTAPRYGDWP